MSRDWKLYLDDMRASVGKALRFTHGYSFEQFITDEKTFDGTVRNLELIGEAAKHIPDALRVRYPDVEWREMAGLRDLISHAYFGLDQGILWDIIQNDLPTLMTQLDEIASNLEGDEPDA